MTPATEVGCWVLPHEALTEVLHRAWDGEDPDVLLVELFANSDPGDEYDDELERCGWADPDTLVRWAAAGCISAATAVLCTWWMGMGRKRRG